MRFLVFQHIRSEHPGIFRDFFAADGVAWDAVELDEGEPIPPLDNYDALMVMGGPMDVWETDRHPWLIPEKAAIRDAVRERNMPYLGLCLGHQLLADALGGACRMMAKPEIGVLDIELTPAAAEDPLFAGLSPRGKALQWHSVEVVEAPKEATVLARAADCANEAMRVGDRAWGIQYHVEITDETVPQWGCIPEYAVALEKRLGQGSLPALEKAVRESLPAMSRDARRLYDNFKAVVQAARQRRPARVAE
ncbi:MAG: type 1 glutamine amidotransferase [Dongiaceae bacterium]